MSADGGCPCPAAFCFRSHRLAADRPVCQRTWGVLEPRFEISDQLNAEIPLCTPGGSDHPDWPHIESAIRQLATNYTHGTDAMARGQRETALRFYNATFTPDAQVMVAGAESTRRIGPEAWADFVENTFRTRDEHRTQHLVGSVNIVLAEDAQSADMSSYMHAAHVRGNGEILTVLLTYVDHVVRTETGWRIAQRTLYPAAQWFEPRKG